MLSLKGIYWHLLDIQRQHQNMNAAKTAAFKGCIGGGGGN